MKNYFKHRDLICCLASPTHTAYVPSETLSWGPIFSGSHPITVLFDVWKQRTLDINLLCSYVQQINRRPYNWRMRRDAVQKGQVTRIMKAMNAPPRVADVSTLNPTQPVSALQSPLLLRPYLTIHQTSVQFLHAITSISLAVSLWLWLPTEPSPVNIFSLACIRFTFLR